jgi:ABC-type spermidine/putrescine transport system permease subunit II
MNKAILIVLIPALLVAVGYVFVLRYMGFAPGYPRLIIAMAVFFGAIYWLSRRGRAARKARSNQP